MVGLLKNLKLTVRIVNRDFKTVVKDIMVYDSELIELD